MTNLSTVVLPESLHETFDEIKGCMDLISEADLDCL